MKSRAPCALAAVLLLAACGNAMPPVAAPPSAKPAAAAPQTDEWAPLSWEERHDVMTWSLLPAMMPVIQRTFATPEPRLNCRTCHGKDAEAVAYRMPNGLPPLDPEHWPSGKVADAMKNDVTPLLSEILGKRETCFSCHPAAKGAK